MPITISSTWTSSSSPYLGLTECSFFHIHRNTVPFEFSPKDYRSLGSFVSQGSINVFHLEKPRKYPVPVTNAYLPCMSTYPAHFSPINDFPILLGHSVPDHGHPLFFRTTVNHHRLPRRKFIQHFFVRMPLHIGTHSSNGSDRILLFHRGANYRKVTLSRKNSFGFSRRGQKK